MADVLITFALLSFLIDHVPFHGSCAVSTRTKASEAQSLFMGGDAQPLPTGSD
ncbi:MAG: hypothetical protein OXC62_17820 [Aestuariivita sp.]|nr:hypothetical protein [Aestuariivita sp.]